MDLLNSDGPGATALDRLCATAAHELLMRSYTRRTLNRYKRVWERLTEFAHAQACAPEYSRELALRFETYGLREGEQLNKGEPIASALAWEQIGAASETGSQSALGWT